MWDLPGPGLKHVSPALAGGFLTTAAPGKPSSCDSDMQPGLEEMMGKFREVLLNSPGLIDLGLPAALHFLL